MTRDVESPPIAREELRFFGNVAAAISHEINNKLAVINEKAGLLGDLAAMLARGREVDPERFDTQSRKIIDQVRLAKQIVERLNRFAHSVDTEVTTFDVQDLLEFVVSLYARKAAAAEVELSVELADRQVTVTASPFVLQTLIGRGLDIALAGADESGAVSVSATASDRGVHVRYAGLAGVTEPIELPDPEHGVPALLAWTGARYCSERHGTALLLEIPDHQPPTQGRTP